MKKFTIFDEVFTIFDRTKLKFAYFCNLKNLKSKQNLLINLIAIILDDSVFMASHRVKH